MKKKLWFAIGAVILVVAAFFIFQTDFFSGEKGEKEVFVTVKDEVKNVVLLERARFHTDAETLGDFLEEKKETLGVVMVNSEYGRFVTTVKNLASTDMQNGPWWMYAYESPSKNLTMEVGQAPGVDEVGLSDQDEVIFVFTQDMGF